jgi:hypothetical protein
MSEGHCNWKPAWVFEVFLAVKFLCGRPNNDDTRLFANGRG